MKTFVSLVVLCFALNSGMGAPATGRYMFVKCNPRGGNANCLTYRSPEMKLSADLLDKLPASATQYIWFILGAMIALHHRCAAPPSQSLISLTQARGAELVEEEPVTEQKQPEVETAMFLPEDGSGGFEGSAVGLPFVMADGSGKYWTEVETPQAGDAKAEYQPAEGELEEDHLLHP